MKRLVFLLMVCVMFAGCASPEKEIQDPTLKQIVNGKTSRKEVLALLGDPSNITHDSMGRTIYYYRKSLPPKKSWDSRFTILSIYKEDNENDERLIVTTIFFGPDDVVNELKTAQENTDLRKQLY